MIEPKPIPLLHNGDFWTIEVDMPTEGTVRITCLLCYPHNDPNSGSFENFRDLQDSTQQAILQQIQRRYRGVTILR